jgi:hypothetical protein
MNTANVNIQELRSLYKSDTKVKAIFDLYAERERGRQDSTVPRMRRVLKEEKGVEMDAEELSEFYRQMQKAGVGRCVAGRRGKVSRFIWGFHLKSIADAVKGIDTAELKAAPAPKVKLPKLAPKPVSPKPASKPTLRHEDLAAVDRKVTVRKAGFEIDFPLDMTEADWKDAATFLNNLQAVS